MSEIPEDIYGEARKAYDEGFEKYGGNKIEAIAKAIWAERRNCAKIAEEWSRYLVWADGKPDHLKRHYSISQAILNQTEE